MKRFMIALVLGLAVLGGSVLISKKVLRSFHPPTPATPLPAEALSETRPIQVLIERNSDLRLNRQSIRRCLENDPR